MALYTIVRKMAAERSDKPVLIIQNIPREGPGILGQVLDSRGIKSRIVHLNSGDLLPRLEIPRLENFGAIIILGGPDSANDDTPKMGVELGAARRCLNENIPYLGICLGMQILVEAAGGEVVQNSFREIGLTDPEGTPYKVTLTEAGRQDPLFDGLNDDELPIFHLHGETVVPPHDVTLMAKGNLVPNQIVRVGKNAYGIQDHLELTDEMLEDWLYDDPWLAQQDTDKIKAQFDLIKAQYTQTALTLFTNFLRVAQLID